ncbi:MAG: alanine racemase [Actinobacteria bacterium]|nr:alanine racemase [Actinomycetota bacterium]
MQPPATPYLVIDAAVMDANLRRMQAFVDESGIALRPHAKTHKLVEVARHQLELGARGLTVATIGEAEVFAAAGVRDIFIGNPVVTSTPDRLRALTESVRLTVALDSVEGARRLSGIDGLHALVEIDCGLGRTGVEPAGAASIARAASDCGLLVNGVFTFPGQSYSPGAGPGAAAAEASALAAARGELVAAGFVVEVVSGGSTPSAPWTGSGVTETRPGVYVFNDAQQVALGVAAPNEVALSIRSTVISTPVPGRIVLDAGSKVLAADRPPYVTGHGLLPAHPDAVIDRIWEHHGVVDVSRCTNPPRLGDVLDVWPNHVCTAVNLSDEVYVRQGGELVERWSVAARGRNR